MRLQTPEKIRTLQRKLYLKAKAEPDFRFYLLYDKVYREDILFHAYRLARSNKGAPGVDGQSFEEIEAMGLEGWLSGIRDDLRAKTYRPEPVRRAMVPKPGGGERPLGIPTIRAKYLSLTHDLTGLGSTRVVRLCASARSRCDEPDDMATGTQDGKVLRCAGALRVEGFFGD